MVPVVMVPVFYRPPTKLREGNVFTGVCLFTGRGRVSVAPGSFLVPGPMTFLELGYLWFHVPWGWSISGPMSLLRVYPAPHPGYPTYLDGT